MKYTFILPLYIDLPISPKARSAKNIKRLEAGKPFNRYWLNLNQYRNWGHMLEHKLKASFQPIEAPQSFQADKVVVSYHIERTGRTVYDIRNVDSIVDKYFLDWLVENKYIPDDNLKHVSYGTSTGANGCKGNRAVCTVETF